MVVPVTRDGQVVLVRQYRHGVRQVVLEIPGGVLERGRDGGGRCRAGTARRDGLRFRDDSRARPPDAESVHQQRLPARCRWPKDAGRWTAQDLDPLEQIEVVLRPLGEIPGMIASGEICHAQVIAAFVLAGYACR